MGQQSKTREVRKESQIFFSLELVCASFSGREKKERRGQIVLVDRYKFRKEQILF
jgi:hypothetical protein